MHDDALGHLEAGADILTAIIGESFEGKEEPDNWEWSYKDLKTKLIAAPTLIWDAIHVLNAVDTGSSGSEATDACVMKLAELIGMGRQKRMEAAQ